MVKYRKPDKRVHRGFLYLDDETVINSLSAVESGKIDEIVAKVISAREGGFGGGVGFSGVQVEGSRKSNSSLEEEIVRTRTRFSAFEVWYKGLIDAKAIGRFDGWGADSLDGVEPGDTIEFRASIEVAALQTLIRLFFWFAGQARTQGSMFSQKGAQLEATKTAEKVMKALLGSDESRDEVLLSVFPVGGEGPAVVMPVNPHWLIGRLGELGGEYTVIAQVNQVLTEGDELPAIRLTRDVAPTPLEITTLKGAVANFVEPAKGLGIEISESDAAVRGPALVLTPIAVYK